MSTNLRCSAVPLEGGTDNSVQLLRTAPKSQPHFASTARGSVWAPSGTFGARGERWQVLVRGEPAVPSCSQPAPEHISTAGQEGIKPGSHLYTSKYKQPRQVWKFLSPEAGAVQHPQLAGISVETGSSGYVWIWFTANGKETHETDWNPCALLHINIHETCIVIISFPPIHTCTHKFSVYDIFKCVASSLRKIHILTSDAAAFPSSCSARLSSLT